MNPYRWPCYPEPDPFPSDENLYRAAMDRMRTAFEQLPELRQAGVTHVTFFQDGSLASVTFGPALAPSDAHSAPASPEDQQLSPRPMPTARLIPRVQRDG